MIGWYLFIVFVTPCLGLWLVESGEYGPSIGQTGYPNGATLAYVVCWLIVVLIAWWVATLGRRKGNGQIRVGAAEDEHFRHYAINLIFLDAIFLFVHLFVFGGIDVLRGTVDKGEFRVLLGPYGAVAFMMIKFIVPTLMAYAAFLYRLSTPSRFNRILLITNVLIVVLIGAGWGTKSLSAAMLMPALLLLFWRVTLKQLGLIGVGVVVSFIAFSYYFDLASDDLVSTLDFVWRRATVLQGDVPWLAWNHVVTGGPLPNYGKTLLAVFGDRTLTALLGVDPVNYSQWVDYHYGLLITEFVGSPLWQVEGGYSVTGTFFTEGLIAGGRAGVLLFSVIGGVAVGFVVRRISQARDANRPVAASLWANYFCFIVFPWLNSGGITNFLHISTLAGVLASAGCVYLMRAIHVRAVDSASRGNAIALTTGVR